MKSLFAFQTKQIISFILESFLNGLEAPRSLATIVSDLKSFSFSDKFQKSDRMKYKYITVSSHKLMSYPTQCLDCGCG